MWGNECHHITCHNQVTKYFSDQIILHENGYGIIVGRIKDMIIRGGENIFPKEIEEHLEKHPFILEAQVNIFYINCGCCS